MIIKAPIKNRIVQLLKVRFDKEGLIIKSLPEEDNTDISISIQTGNRGEDTENLNQKDRQNSDLIHQRVPNLPTTER